MQLADSLGSLQTVAITDTTAPRLVSTCHVADAAEDVALDGTSAYVAGKGGLYVVDVKDPIHPIQIGVYPLPDQAHRVAMSGTRAYVLSDKQLLALDVSTPATPRLLGSYDMDGSQADLTASGDLVYVASWDGLHILDAGQPEQIAQVGLWSVQDTHSPFIKGQTSYLFVQSSTEATHAGVYAVDVSTPSNPVEKYRYNTDIGDGLAVADGFA